VHKCVCMFVCHFVGVGMCVDVLQGPQEGGAGWTAVYVVLLVCLCMFGICFWYGHVFMCLCCGDLKREVPGEEGRGKCVCVCVCVSVCVCVCVCHFVGGGMGFGSFPGRVRDLVCVSCACRPCVSLQIGMDTANLNCDR
jgi:hypothetical protein